MPIRDIIVVVAILTLVPVSLFRPWIGVLAWAWLAFMNPHKHTWYFGSDIPYAMLIAVATLAGFVLTRDRKRFLWTPETIALIALWAWFTITSVFAIHQDLAWAKWNEVTKIIGMALLIIPLFQDRTRLRWLLLVIAGSVGFYAVKALPFVIMTGGQSMVRGAPGDTQISTNNAIGMALNVCIPIFLHLAREERVRWRKLALYGMFYASIPAVLFTYSRGAVLGLLIVLAALFLSRRTFLPMIASGLVLWFMIAWFAPDRWVARMDTIQNYQTEMSANLRLESWRVGFEIALDSPIVGGGFKAFGPVTFGRFAPNYPGGYHDGHSIYFNLMGEHGFVGLIIFLVLIGYAFVNLQKVRRWTRRHPSRAWAGNYAHMLQCSYLGWLSTGAFLSAAYFELAYHMLVIGIVVQHLAKQAAAEPAATPPTPPVQVKPARWPVAAIRSS